MSRSIKVRILVMLGGLAAGYFVLLAVVQIASGSTHQRMERVSAALFPASSALGDAENALAQMRKEYKNAVLLEDRASLSDAKKASDEVVAALDRVHQCVSASDQLKKRAIALSEDFARLNAASQDTYASVLQSKENLSDELQGRVGRLARQNTDFAAEMQGLDDTLAAESRKEFAAIDATSVRVSLIGWVVLAFALLGCGGGWLSIHLRVLLPLQGLARRMQDIAGADGDLTVRMPITAGKRRRNELDEVGHWFNVFIERIEQIVVRVMQNAAALGEASLSLASMARESASQSELQQQQAERITLSMADIAAAVRDIGTATTTAARDARTAEANAHTGGETIEAALSTIQRLLDANQTTAEKIEALGRASDAIGRIVHVIDDIASQTNLLALNAAIESARAGEHGRGFAVVAGEVRRLANRTSQATREIGATASSIQQGTALAVEAMRASVGHAHSGVSAAQATGEALTNIIRGSEALQVMVTQIASASGEQSTATANVNDNIHEIVTLGERTITTMASAVNACEHVSNLAANLNELVASFKVSPADKRQPTLT